MASLYASVSKVDSFRKLQTEDYVTEESFIADIKGESKVGWQATYGSALHACIEDPDRWIVGAKDGTYRYEWQDPKLPPPGPFDRAIVWPAEIVDACVAAWPKPCVFEARIPETTWKVGAHTVTVAGRTDGTHGTVIVDGKTKFGQVDLAEYAPSLQWRFYLNAIPWASALEYRIHDIGGMDSDEKGELHIVKNGPRLNGIHVLRMYRQPGMQAELQGHLEQFVAWAESRKLLSYLKRYEAKP